MHTKDKLAAALEEIGLAEMAAKARTGYYHDVLSPLDTPTTQLVNDLQTAGPFTMALRDRVIYGAFDGTAEESAASPEEPPIRRLAIRTTHAYSTTNIVVDLATGEVWAENFEHDTFEGAKNDFLERVGHFLDAKHVHRFQGMTTFTNWLQGMGAVVKDVHYLGTELTEVERGT